MATPGPSNTMPDDDSATENSDDQEYLILKGPSTHPRPLNIYSPSPLDKTKVNNSTSGSELPKETRKPEKSVSSDRSPPPARPSASKKAKQAMSSSDSDESNKVVPGPSTRRGARQPIKRGARRF